MRTENRFSSIGNFVAKSLFCNYVRLLASVDTRFNNLSRYTKMYLSICNLCTLVCDNVCVWSRIIAIITRPLKLSREIILLVLASAIFNRRNAKVKCCSYVGIIWKYVPGNIIVLYFLQRSKVRDILQLSVLDLEWKPWLWDRSPVRRM